MLRASGRSWVKTFGRLAQRLKVSLLKAPTFRGGIRKTAHSLKLPRWGSVLQRLPTVAAGVRIAAMCPKRKLAEPQRQA